MSIQKSDCLSRAYNASFHFFSETASSLAKSGFNLAERIQVPLTVAFIAGCSIHIGYEGCKKIQESPRVWGRLAGIGMVGVAALGVSAAAVLAFPHQFPLPIADNAMCREFFMEYDTCCSNRTDTAIYSKMLPNSSIFSCFPNGSSIIESTPRLNTIS